MGGWHFSFVLSLFRIDIALFKGLQFTPENANVVRSFNTDRDSIARDTANDDRYSVADGNSLSNFSTEYEHFDSLRKIGALVAQPRIATDSNWKRRCELPGGFPPQAVGNLQAGVWQLNTYTKQIECRLRAGAKNLTEASHNSFIKKNLAAIHANTCHHAKSL